MGAGRGGLGWGLRRGVRGIAARLGLLTDERLQFRQGFRPHERRGLGRIITRHVTGEPGGGLGVFQNGIAEDLPANGGEAGIVGDQFCARVDVVVVVVVLAVVVEP